MGYEVKIGLSNKHLHLQKEHIEILFGKGHELTPTKPLVQPGQFACEEKVDIVGPKNTLKGIRVLGPARPETQVEVAMTDARTLGIKAPVRESGKLEGTPGCKIVGPCGEVEIDHGVIVALRHVHLSPAQAEEAGVKDKDIVSIKIEGERGLVFNNVLVRSGDAHEREVHLDTDEGNAAGCGPDAVCTIIK
ncbi:MAG: phosphate propanoyltransferase [Clostridia bacterium]|nr:phosphate propanoyltransferase [Clostridiales bacterium]MDD7308173.1 phosphate propanoyltransferase [Eubacteriales bacterium]MDO4352331.1 phosphate propanoyltransferase [Clostridia bacterium]MDY2934116.1 phosphate propanoyltransferase [Anaerovoracaceae bacterium]MEE0181014.1 phosphate propanoyltransferase [Anaerovoracaceae bacterium]